MAAVAQIHIVPYSFRTVVSSATANAGLRRAYVLTLPCFWLCQRSSLVRLRWNAQTKAFLYERLQCLAGAAGYITDIRDDLRPREVPAATARVLHALELSTMHERRAQQELVYVVSARVLDAVQWCAVAAALHPLHCDLEPLLCAIAQLPETPPCAVSTATAFR